MVFDKNSYQREFMRGKRAKQAGFTNSVLLCTAGISVVRVLAMVAMHIGNFSTGQKDNLHRLGSDVTCFDYKKGSFPRTWVVEFAHARKSRVLQRVAMEEQECHNSRSVVV